MILISQEYQDLLKENGVAFLGDFIEKLQDEIIDATGIKYQNQLDALVELAYEINLSKEQLRELGGLMEAKLPSEVIFQWFKRFRYDPYTGKYSAKQLARRKREAQHFMIKGDTIEEVEQKIKEAEEVGTNE